jgi:penicillin G amidase
MTTPAAVRLLMPAAVLAGLVYVGARPVGPLPPLGGFLEPVRGVWALARRPSSPRDPQVVLPGIAGQADVRIDRRGVPHIFAASELDAYRALGYLHARDRLFQIEIQTRAAAGTLSEIAGAAALPIDRVSRRIGLAWSAERKFAAIDTTGPSFRALRAYGEGINGYVAQMAPADLPLAYRLLHRTPMRWEPKHAVYLLARMAQTLSYADDEIKRERVRALVGVRERLGRNRSSRWPAAPRRATTSRRCPRLARPTPRRPSVPAASPSPWPPSRQRRTGPR